MKGARHALVFWARRASTRDFCPAWAAAVSLVQKLFDSPHTILLHLSPTSNKLGRQSRRVAFPSVRGQFF
jgi:hypothetical protein